MKATEAPYDTIVKAQSHPWQRNASRESLRRQLGRFVSVYKPCSQTRQCSCVDAHLGVGDVVGDLHFPEWNDVCLEDQVIG